MEKRHGIPVWKEIETPPPPRAGAREAHEIVIAGGGPVGMAMALDLAQRGRRVLIVSQWDFIPAYSKAICWSKRSLEILDRLGVAQRMVAKGVIWNTGKVFWGDSRDPVYEFDLLPVKGQKQPAFINLQQYYVEEYLYDALRDTPNVELRYGQRITGVAPAEKSVHLMIETASGAYEIETDWLIACDGNKSTVRDLMGLDFEGRVFEDNFLIADIKMKMERPSERWFWFDPPFNPGQSALLHKQPDDVWRIDLQLGWDIDRDACVRPENVDPYLRAMLGDDVEFTREWYSVYTFQCRRMKRFVHGRVIFAGDSAHLVSPFGARGCNGGLADIDNLGWKLDLVLSGAAPEELLESYNHEAIVTADENILNSSRATDFITPKSQVSRTFRDAALSLARDHQFARGLVNSGRLSTAVAYQESPLSTADEDEWAGGVAPGSPPLDAPLGDGWTTDRLGGSFALLCDGAGADVIDGVRVLDVSQFGDAETVRQRYDLRSGSAYLFRPDQYVAARWRTPTRARIQSAVQKASGGRA